MFYSNTVNENPTIIPNFTNNHTAKVCQLFQLPIFPNVWKFTIIQHAETQIKQFPREKMSEIQKRRL